jgi:hypothetical protein
MKFKWIFLGLIFLSTYIHSEPVTLQNEMTGEMSAFMEKYTGGIEPQDDMTLLVMEIEY